MPLLNIPARVVRTARRLHLRLPAAYQHAAVFIAALERTINQGVPRSAMPGFGGVLTESQIAGLARHVLELRCPLDVRRADRRSLPLLRRPHLDAPRPQRAGAAVRRGLLPNGAKRTTQRCTVE